MDLTLHPNFEALTLELQQRRGNNPPLLFLGADVARAAGVPDLVTVARAILPTLDKSYAGSSELPDDALQQAFYRYLESMSRMARRSMLQRYYSRLPVPRFYQDLVQLILGGYFQQIVTTGIDTLLEDAIEQSGCRRGVDYQATSFLQTERGYNQRTVTPETPIAPIRIVKLHGDISLPQMAITPDEIADALLPQRLAVKGALDGDIVMVGYQFESPPLDDFLRWTNGTIWWVSVEPPSSAAIAFIEQAHTITFLHDEVADPQTFFGLLHMMVGQLQSAATEPPTDDESTLESATPRGLDAVNVSLHSGYGYNYSKGGLDEPSGILLQEVYLRTQLDQSRGSLTRLSQQLVATGNTNSQLLVQIEYEQQQIATLEDQLRAIFYTPDEVISRVRSVMNAVRRNCKEEGKYSFARKQVNTVEWEYEQTKPDQLVIGAAIGAITLLAIRLGTTIVPADLLTALLPLAPSAVTRRPQ